MPTLSWYWQRLQAMSASEVALHARKKWRQLGDGRRTWDFSAVKLDSSGVFPKLPKPEDAPEALRDALKRDTENILAGRWKAFGHLDLQVDDPPQWHKDYLAGQNLATEASAFQLDYRELPDGADIKLIWELSRWHQLTRLAMATYVLGEDRAAAKCVEWLEDWVKRNPPYRGWNWTSALEVGMRLVQFTWIDALLGTATVSGSGSRVSSLESGPREGGRNSQIAERLDRLRAAILLPHTRYAWRHKSFGSSANNHLIGELAGLILAAVRWPALAQWGASLDELQSHWEHEVLAQFAEDGGNKEQALNYHLFSWEFCWQAFKALEASGHKVPGHVEQRLSFSARFFWEAQTRKDHWDYGDCDSSFVSPVFANHAVGEWHQWFENPRASAAIGYWWGDPPASMPPVKRGIPLNTVECREWWLYPDTGIAICESGFWWLRWDLSPLGYRSTAAHGHLDALHLSVWCKGVALVIDPGTGAYYADRSLRNWLASRAAHNGPCPDQPERPRRLGPFLWAEHHSIPILDRRGSSEVGVLNLPGTQLRRQITHLLDGQGWQIDDRCIAKNGCAAAFTTRWQFGPGTWVKRLGERRFAVHRMNVALLIEVEGDWSEIEMVELAPTEDKGIATPVSTGSYEGIVSPAFRETCRAPYLKLVARPQGDKPCLFRTTFLSSQM